MSLIAEDPRPVLLPRRSPPSRPAVAEHDLPILAVEQDPHPRPDWETLLAGGVEPCLALGAERRLHGSR